MSHFGYRNETRMNIWNHWLRSYARCHLLMALPTRPGNAGQSGLAVVANRDEMSKGEKFALQDLRHPMVNHFRTRRLMTFVALTAVMLAVTCRAIGYQRCAQFHQREADKVQDLLFPLAFSPAPAGFQQPPPPTSQGGRFCFWRSFRAYHERMKGKYASAGRPFLSSCFDSSDGGGFATATALQRNARGWDQG
ncbi:hypothetical protein SAMN05444166_7223 [Singulisphaera sp. GP187]|nr:hypothetical protein SAMN05444166_7223 [Singulisphaera sp. GP187]